jgi:Ni/Co efflux regulator RcnB
MRHILISALAISLLAGPLSSAYADSRHDRADHQQRSDRNNYHSSHDRNDGRRDGRADGRRDDRHSSNNRYDRDRNGRYSNNSWQARQYESQYDRNYGRRDNSRYDSRYRYDRGFYPTYRDSAYRNQAYRFHGGSYYRPHGYRAYSWRYGDRLPIGYYAPRYVIHDYRAYHLGYPPRGYHWVRVDNDVILAAITTGIVVQVVNDLFY